MPSRLITLFSLPCLAASLLVSVAGPAVAEEPIDAADRVHGGMYIEEWEKSTQLDAIAGWVGKRVSFLGTFHDVNEDDLLPPGPYSNTITKLEEAWLGKATPFANLAINAGAASIAAGHHDPDIRAWALKVQRWLAKGGERSLIIAPLQEMNGDWVPYGMDPGGFKSAYHHIRGIVREAVVDDTQVRWAFAPNGWSTPPYKIKDYYPGDEVVDLIGISAYNFGDCYATWSSVYQTMGGAVHELRTTVSATKPYIIAQTGSSSCGGDKDAWLRELFAFTAADPNVVALIYFNIDKETDWRVWPDANQGWKDGMLAPTTVYQWPLSSWFQAGPLPFRPRASAFWDDNGSPHEVDINKIYTAGITQGCGPGRFCPKDPVTRAQMAAFLLRALPGEHDRHLLGYRGTFHDVPAGLWYTGYVEHLFDGEHRITNGCGSQPLLYCPEQQVTRGQMAAFLVRALGLAPGGDDRFGDDRSHQFEADINALAAVGITKGCGPGRFCPDGPVTREQMASFLARAFLAGS